MSTQVVASSFGGPEALTVVHQDVPAPGPGQVTVAVRAAGMNPIDFKLYSGHMGADASTLPMPMPVGDEVAGVVTAVGEGARGRAGAVSVGDEVIACPITGGYADAVTVDASAITPKPAAMSFEDAAGLMLAGATAVHGLTAVGITGGTTVLVHGVSGGVGLTAAQIAIADGATVVGTASEKHHENLRARGIVPVAYGEGLAERVREAAPDGVDGAFGGQDLPAGAGRRGHRPAGWRARRRQGRAASLRNARLPRPVPVVRRDTRHGRGPVMPLVAREPQPTGAIRTRSSPAGGRPTPATTVSARSQGRWSSMNGSSSACHRC